MRAFLALLVLHSGLHGGDAERIARPASDKEDFDAEHGEGDADSFSELSASDVEVWFENADEGRHARLRRKGRVTWGQAESQLRHWFDHHEHKAEADMDDSMPTSFFEDQEQADNQADAETATGDLGDAFRNLTNWANPNQMRAYACTQLNIDLASTIGGGLPMVLPMASALGLQLNLGLKGTWHRLAHGCRQMQINTMFAFSGGIDIMGLTMRFGVRLTGLLTVKERTLNSAGGLMDLAQRSRLRCHSAVTSPGQCTTASGLELFSQAFESSVFPVFRERLHNFFHRHDHDNDPIVGALLRHQAFFDRQRTDFMLYRRLADAPAGNAAAGAWRGTFWLSPSGGNISCGRWLSGGCPSCVRLRATLTVRSGAANILTPEMQQTSCLTAQEDGTVAVYEKLGWAVDVSQDAWDFGVAIDLLNEDDEVLATTSSGGEKSHEHSSSAHSLNADHASVDYMLHWHAAPAAPRSSPTVSGLLEAPLASLMAGFEQFAGKLPAYAAQVDERLVDNDRDSGVDCDGIHEHMGWLNPRRGKVRVNRLGQCQCPLPCTDGTSLHRSQEALRDADGGVADDRVLNFAKAQRISLNRTKAEFHANLAVSGSNLFLRVVGDVVALMSVYFADTPNWDGHCCSLKPRFRLPYESGEGEAIERRAGQWADIAGRQMVAERLHEDDESVSEDAMGPADGRYNPFDHWHWSYGWGYDDDSTESTQAARQAFLKPTKPTRLGLGPTVPLTTRSAEMTPHVFCSAAAETADRVLGSADISEAEMRRQAAALQSPFLSAEEMEEAAVRFASAVRSLRNAQPSPRILTLSFQDLCEQVEGCNTGKHNCETVRMPVVFAVMFPSFTESVLGTMGRIREATQQAVGTEDLNQAQEAASRVLAEVRLFLADLGSDVETRAVEGALPEDDIPAETLALEAQAAERRGQMLKKLEADMWHGYAYSVTPVEEAQSEGCAVGGEWERAPLTAAKFVNFTDDCSNGHRLSSSVSFVNSDHEDSDGDDAHTVGIFLCVSSDTAHGSPISRVYLTAEECEGEDEVVMNGMYEQILQGETSSGGWFTSRHVNTRLCMSRCTGSVTEAAPIADMRALDVECKDVDEGLDAISSGQGLSGKIYVHARRNNLAICAEATRRTTGQVVLQGHLFEHFDAVQLLIGNGTYSDSTAHWRDATRTRAMDRLNHLLTAGQTPHTVSFPLVQTVWQWTAMVNVGRVDFCVPNNAAMQVSRSSKWSAVSWNPGRWSNQEVCWTVKVHPTRFWMHLMQCWKRDAHNGGWLRTTDTFFTKNQIAAFNNNLQSMANGWSSNLDPHHNAFSSHFFERLQGGVPFSMASAVSNAFGSTMAVYGGIGVMIARAALTRQVAERMLEHESTVMVRGAQDMRDAVWTMYMMTTGLLEDADLNEFRDNFGAPIVQLLVAQEQCPLGYWKVQGFFTADNEPVDEVRQAEIREGVDETDSQAVPSINGNLYQHEWRAARFFNSKRPVVCALSMSCGDEGVRTTTGHVLSTAQTPAACECQAACAVTHDCVAWEHSAGTCTQYDRVEAMSAHAACTDTPDEPCVVGGQSPTVQAYDRLWSAPQHCSTRCGSRVYEAGRGRTFELMNTQNNICGTDECTASTVEATCPHGFAKTQQRHTWTRLFRSGPSYWCCRVMQCTINSNPITDLHFVTDRETCVSDHENGIERQLVWGDADAESCTSSDVRQGKFRVGGEKGNLCVEKDPTKPPFTGLTMVRQGCNRRATMKRPLSESEREFGVFPACDQARQRCEMMNAVPSQEKAGGWGAVNLRLPSRFWFCAKTAAAAKSVGGGQTGSLVQLALDARAAAGRQEPLPLPSPTLSLPAWENPIDNFVMILNLFTIVKKDYIHAQRTLALPDGRTESTMFCRTEKSGVMHVAPLVFVKTNFGVGYSTAGFILAYDFTPWLIDPVNRRLQERHQERVRLCERCIQEDDSAAFCDLHGVATNFRRDMHDVCPGQLRAPGTGDACRSIVGIDFAMELVRGRWIESADQCGIQLVPLHVNNGIHGGRVIRHDADSFIHDSFSFEG